MLKNKFLYVIFYSYFVYYNALKIIKLTVNNSLFDDENNFNICRILLTVISLPYTLKKLLTSL
ncbi:hypothetical protein HNP24_000309 [Chryseobacterium sediminis]|uniref:Uncharacterized protein n=1 Tax=Chryseobacterium sediminis TaxID=1679494 RepID=A0ABR6PYP6_9FLAO|nr:hypothetical protein [Chryseobacterium sediminis]